MRTSTSFGELQPRPLFEAAIVRRAAAAAFAKLNPLHQLKNPVRVPRTRESAAGHAVVA